MAASRVAASGPGGRVPQTARRPADSAAAVPNPAPPPRGLVYLGFLAYPSDLATIARHAAIEAASVSFIVRPAVVIGELNNVANAEPLDSR